MPEALLALGGNVGDSRTLLDKAIHLLCRDDQVRLLRRSSDYRTPPWGNTDQDPFINLCIAVETSLKPHALLERAQEVERSLGRDRATERRWGPRTVDIDILDYDGFASGEGDLKLPHPRVLERAFVLIPLAEIAPGRIIAGHTISEAARNPALAADAARIERLLPR